MYLLLVFLLLFVSVESAGAVNWPLKKHATGQYLVDQDNVPFLMIGDAGWSAAVALNSTDLAVYMNDRQAKGFTVIMIQATDPHFQPFSPNNWNGDAPFSGGVNNWASPNEAYWLNVDAVLNAAKNRNMVVLFFPAYIGFNCGVEGWCANMQAQTNTAMQNYGAFIGDRYKNQGNIIWMHGGDANANDYTNAAARVAAIRTGILGADTGGHLHSAHSAPERSALDDYSSLIDVNTTYSYTSSQTEIQNDYQRVGALPFMYVEGHYEGSGSDTPTVLQGQIYNAYLGGALLGHVFGNDPLWYFGSGWASELSSAGNVSMQRCAQLMKSRAWWLLAPDYSNAIVTSSKGTGTNYKATAQTTGGETTMVWNPTTATVTVQMSLLGGATSHAWWWNPDTNATTDLGNFSNSGTQVFTPPAARRMLVLDNLASNLAAPGSTVYSQSRTAMHGAGGVSGVVRIQ